MLYENMDINKDYILEYMKYSDEQTKNQEEATAKQTNSILSHKQRI